MAAILKSIITKIVRKNQIGNFENFQWIFDLIGCHFSQGSFSFDGGSDSVGESRSFHLHGSNIQPGFGKSFCYSILLGIIILVSVCPNSIWVTVFN